MNFHDYGHGDEDALRIDDHKDYDEEKDESGEQRWQQYRMLNAFANVNGSLGMSFLPDERYSEYGIREWY